MVQGGAVLGEAVRGEAVQGDPVRGEVVGVLRVRISHLSQTMVGEMHPLSQSQGNAGGPSPLGQVRVQVRVQVEPHDWQ